MQGVHIGRPEINVAGLTPAARCGLMMPASETCLSITYMSSRPTITNTGGSPESLVAEPHRVAIVVGGSHHVPDAQDWRRRNQLRGAALTAFSPSPQHVAKVVVDRVQVLRLGVDRRHLDDEAVADHAIAERRLRRVAGVPGEVHGLPVARLHPRALRLGQRGREMLDRIELDHLPQQVALRRRHLRGREPDLLGVGAFAAGVGQNVVGRRVRRSAPCPAASATDRPSAAAPDPLRP